MITPILNDIRVLICRPEASAKELAEVMQSVGAKCEILPTISIDPIALIPKKRKIISDLDQFQHVIVTSQHAAEIGLSLIDDYWPQLPIKQRWYAIGRKTAKNLQAISSTLIAPEMDLNSEDLLARPELQNVRGQKILLLKGEGGRKTLAQSLESRGATVQSLDLYRRTCPKYETETLVNSLEKFNPLYIVALSGSTLNNLVSLCANAKIELSQRRLILSSKRVANIAFEYGFKLTCVPENLMPIDIIRCIANDSRNRRT